MKLETFIIWLVVLGFLFSLHGRVEPESDAGPTSISQGVSNLTDDNRPSPLNKPLPTGDHKDQHGCYHVHAPFTVSAVELPCQLSFFLFTADLSSPYSSPPSEVIPYPPRV